MANKLAGFRRGLIANLLNPKALVFYLLVVGQFADPRLGHLWLQILLLGSLHILLSLIVHVTIVLVADHLGGLLEKWRTSFAARIGFGLALAIVALWIAMSTSRA